MAVQHEGSEHWHEGEAIQMLRATRYLVESLIADGVPFDGKRYQAAIVTAHNTQNWDAYLHALRTYADAAKDAYIDYWELRGKTAPSKLPGKQPTWFL